MAPDGNCHHGDWQPSPSWHLADIAVMAPGSCCHHGALLPWPPWRLAAIIIIVPGGRCCHGAWQLSPSPPLDFLFRFYVNVLHFCSSLLWDTLTFGSGFQIPLGLPLDISKPICNTAISAASLPPHYWLMPVCQPAPQPALQPFLCH
jgi:hypothetical protein